MLSAWLSGLEALAPVAALRTSPMLYAGVNALHILALGALIGSILTLDLRVLGVWQAAGWRSAVPVVSPVAATALALALLTGALLFAVRPFHYLANPPFLAKLALVAAGIANAAFFHRRLSRRQGPAPEFGLRLGALASILIWTGAIFAGRFIAFVH